MNKPTPEPGRTGPPPTSAESLGLSADGYPDVDPARPAGAFTAMADAYGAGDETDAYDAETMAHARLLVAEIVARARLIPPDASEEDRAGVLLKEAMQVSEMLAYRVLDDALNRADPATVRKFRRRPEDLRPLIEDLIDGATTALLTCALDALARMTDEREGAAS